MRREHGRAPITLMTIRFSTSAPGISDERCAECNGHFQLNQPDIEDPNRLLAVCGGCHRWYVIELTPESEDALMFLMPEDARYRDVRAN